METRTMNPEGEPEYASEHTDRSESPKGLSNPQPEEASDVFKDTDCGEPLTMQRIVLDFTPTEEDTDFIQSKCCAFWDFINKQPELHSLDAADLELSAASSDNDYVSTLESPGPIPKMKSVEKTALSMLELVEEKGLIDRALASRLPTSHCSIGLDWTRTNYEEESIKTPRGEYKVGPVAPRLSITPTQMRVRSQMMKKPRDATSTPAVRSMCQSFEEWDMEHPKSMEPPGPTPNLDSDVIKQPNKPKPRKECGCDNISCRMKKSTH